MLLPPGRGLRRHSGQCLVRLLAMAGHYSEVQLRLGCAVRLLGLLALILSLSSRVLALPAGPEALLHPPLPRRYLPVNMRGGIRACTSPKIQDP